MKNFFDKYGKELNCSECPHLTLCLDKKEPQCASGYMQFQYDKIAILEEQLSNAIIPKFDRQEHIYGFAFGEIREYIVVGYLDNNVTLCENILTGGLEWCDNNFLVRTFEEAQAKLEELKNG